MSRTTTPRVFVILLREATLAGELVCSGVTVLRKANMPRSGLYELALFNLSIGFERLCKLIILVDHYSANGATFPTNDILKRQYGHDLDGLFSAVDKIVANRNFTGDYSRRPDSEIHGEIISTLSEFAKTTRYYNLDRLTGGKAAELRSGADAWAHGVGALILDKHYSGRRQLHDVLVAQELDAQMGRMVSGIRFDEAGNSIDTLEQGLIHGARIRVIQKWGPFYCLQLIRHLSVVLEELRETSQRNGLQDIPFFGELFAPFMNDDAVLKSRRTWVLPL